jgi:hypothetical protein
MLNSYKESPGWATFLRNQNIEQWIQNLQSLVECSVQSGLEEYPENELISLLENAPIPHDLRQGVRSVVTGDFRSSLNDCIENHKALYVIGHILAKLFFETRCDAQLILFRMDEWLCWDGFLTRSRIELSKKDNLSTFRVRFTDVIQQMEASPESYVRFRADREQFSRLLEFWKNESTFSEVWNSSYGWGYISMYLHGSSALEALLPEYPEAFCSIIENISYPPIINDLLWIFSRYSSVLPKMLESAPLCAVSDEHNATVWNRSILAPLLLQVCISYGRVRLDEPHRANNKEMFENVIDDLTCLYSSTIEKLMSRDDCKFLGEAFLAELLARNVYSYNHGRDPQKEALTLFIHILSSKLSLPQDAERSSWPEHTFGISREQTTSQASQFLQTGILGTGIERLNITSLRTLLAREPAITSANAQQYLDFVKILLSYRDTGFYTTEFSDFPDDRHRDIASLYVASTDPCESWRQTWQYLSGVRYKLRFSLFNSDSNEQRYALNFVLASGIAATQLLKEQNKTELAALLSKAIENSISNLVAWDHSQERLYPKMLKLVYKIGVGAV